MSQVKQRTIDEIQRRLSRLISKVRQEVISRDQLDAAVEVELRFRGSTQYYKRLEKLLKARKALEDAEIALQKDLEASGIVISGYRTDWPTVLKNRTFSLPPNDKRKVEDDRLARSPKAAKLRKLEALSRDLQLKLDLAGSTGEVKAFLSEVFDILTKEENANE